MHHEEASTSSARSNITSSEGSKSSEQSDGSSQQASRWNITCRCTVNVYPLFISTKKARLMATLKPEWEFGFGPLDFLGFLDAAVCKDASISLYIYSLLTESSPPGRMIRRHLLESSKWRSAHHGSLVDVSQMRSWFEAKSSATPVANDAVYGRSPERVEVGPELREFWSIEAMPNRKEQVQVRIFLHCYATFLWDQVMNVLCKCKVMPWN